jgi:hypothetical protein
LDIAPQVEAEYAQLSRDYEVVKAQYTAMLENYEKAQLGERADDAGSVRFEIIQPATAQFGPVFPPRIQLLLGVLALALAAGAALAWLLNMVRPVVASHRSLAALTDLPVLGIVSPAFPRQMAASARWEILRFAAACCVIVAVFGSVMVLNWLGVRIGGGVS